MSHHDDNLYTILGRLAALQPKPEIKTSKEIAKQIYESVEARGSILSGVDTVQARLAKQFAMEGDESKLEKDHCSDCDCSPCRCEKCNECGMLESKCQCKPDMTEGSRRPDFASGIGDIHTVYVDGKPKRKFKREDDAIDYASDLYDRTNNVSIEVQNGEGGVVWCFDDAMEESQQGVAEAGFPGAPDVEMPPMKPSGDPQRDKLKQEYVDLHREIKSLVDIAYAGDEKAKARIKQLNDRADQIRAILEPRQPPNEWQKKTYGFDDNWNKVNQGVAEDQLDELGNTPDGQAALGAVAKRGDDEITAWNKNPASGFSAIPKDASKHFNASVAAGRRLHGFGPDPSKKNTVLARDAMRRYHNGEPITPEEVKIISKWYPGFKIDEDQQGMAEGEIAKVNDEWFKTGSFIAAKIANKSEPFRILKEPEIIHSREGDLPGNVGDYVIAGPKDEATGKFEYLNNPETFHELKTDNGDGTASPKAIPKQVKLADHDGVLHTSWGDLQYTKGNDYIVRHGTGDYGAVKLDAFAKTYDNLGQGVAEGDVTTHKGTYGTEYQGEPDDDDDKPKQKVPKVSNSKTGKKGRPTKDEKDTLQAKLPWGGKPPKDTYKPDPKGHEHRMSDEPPKSSPERAAWDEKQARKNNRKPKSIKEAIDSVECRLTEGVNLLELLKEKHQTVDEMLAELSTDIANFKESGHCSELLKDCMDIKGAHKKAEPFTALEIAPAHAITPAATRLPHDFNAPSMDRELNELARLAGLSEDCGDMPPIGIAMQDMQSEQDNLSISTTYNSRDGKKTISVNADGKQAEDLLQMLRIAGLGGGEKAQELQARPEIEFDNIDGEMSMVPQDDIEELSNEQSPMILGGHYDAEMDEAEFDVPATEPVNGPKPEYQTMRQSTMGPGEGDPGEKAMHPDRPTNNNGDNALSTPPTRAQKTLIAVSALESKLAAEYESIKKI